MAKKKKFEEESNLGEGQEIEVPSEAVVEEQAAETAPAEPEAPKVTREINEENVLDALKELGGKASVSHIRKQLAQPVFLAKEPKLVWAQDVIRKEVVPKLIESGKVRKVDTGSRVHVVELVPQ
jgi:hypothetical protein